VIILTILFIGLMAGWIANIILGGGTRPADWGELLIAGFAGSFVGGLLANLIAGDGFNIRPSGLIGSALGAVIVLVIWRAVRRSKPKAGSTTHAKSKKR
jgi:uncharacterized membrane protein YeaQ/YmgE (transglycosylase-associated protein family)